MLKKFWIRVQFCVGFPLGLILAMIYSRSFDFQMLKDVWKDRKEMIRIADMISDGKTVEKILHILEFGE